MVYTPIIKEKFFEPSPIVRYGIPTYADSFSNPKVDGTLAHQQWWEEQINYCINGYDTGGIHISGRYYFFLNFCTVTTVGRGVHAPDFIDIQFQFLSLVDWVKKNQKGIYCKKKRRASMSEMMAKAVVGYGMRFRPHGYVAGICAGLDIYSNGFYEKVKNVNFHCPPELKVHYLKDDKKEIKCGWEELLPSGYQDKGSLNRVLCRTMYNNPAIFKGELLDDCIFEEAGEFQMLSKGYDQTRSCFVAEGTKLIGCPFIFGTGGKLTSGAKEFKDIGDEIDENPEGHDLVPFEIDGRRMGVTYFIGSHNIKGEIEEHCPNIEQLIIDKNLSREQVLGCEDTVQLEHDIQQELKRLIKFRNKKRYYEYRIDNPLHKRDYFLTDASNNFDAEIVTTQLIRTGEEKPKYKKYYLDWVLNDNKNSDKYGQPVVPLQVKARPAPDNEYNQEEACIYIRFFPNTLKGWKNLVISGTDSYDQDTALTTKSIGSKIIMARRGNPLVTETGESLKHKRVICASISCRPHRKEQFWEISLKANIFYGIEGNDLIDFAKPGIFKHNREIVGNKYFAPRPKSFEGEFSEQSHDFGFSFTGKSKPMVISLAQSWVLDEMDECWFPWVIEDFANYNVEQTTSDWDNADATFLALARDADMTRMPSMIDEKQNANFDLPIWENRNGRMVRTNGNISKEELENIKDPFLRMIASGELDHSNDESQFNDDY